MKDNPTIEINIGDGRSRLYAEDGVTLLAIDGVPVDPEETKAEERETTDAKTVSSVVSEADVPLPSSFKTIKGGK